jgi:hypothetical protein
MVCVCIATVELVDLRREEVVTSSLYQAALRGAPVPSKKQGLIPVAPLFAIRRRSLGRPGGIPRFWSA